MKHLLIFAFCFPFISFGQNNLKGKILSSKTKEPIAFATAGLIKQNIGLNADEAGNFELYSVKDFQNDTLLITSVGFENKRIAVAAFSNTILLEEKDSVLKDVVVVSKKDWKIETLNKFPTKSKFYYTSIGSETQIAVHFKLPVNGAFLQSVKMLQSRLELSYSKVAVFRIRLYEYDSLTKGPGADLCSEIIEVKSNRKTVNVDLEGHRIYIPQKDFFVAMEWLFTSENKRIDSYKKDGKEGVWTRYVPVVGWTDQNLDGVESWDLDFRGVWRCNTTPAKFVPQISATVKY